MDRNAPKLVGVVLIKKSLSARRAWIEIKALHGLFYVFESLSARRAWIEIQISVSTVVGVLGRSPQGERG